MAAPWPVVRVQRGAGPDSAPRPARRRPLPPGVVDVTSGVLRVDRVRGGEQAVAGSADGRRPAAQVARQPLPPVQTPLAEDLAAPPTVELGSTTGSVRQQAIDNIPV